MRARAMAPAMVPAILAAALAAAPLTAQEWDVQLPADGGTYPTGDLFIQDLDAIWTAAGQVLENASILIQDGVIREIGAGLTAPDGVTVLDGQGRTAIPGLVDEHSHTGMAASNEGTAPVVPEVRVLDALRTDDFGMFRALTGGVTTARIMHGSSNPIGGQSAVIKMRWGMDRTDQLLLPGAPRFVKFALGENVTRKNRRGSGTPRFPMSRPGVEAVYVQAFTAARAYRDAWADYEADPGSQPVPPRRDLRLEALVDIMEGRIRIHAHSYRSDEILMLMRVAERFDFKIDVFTHVLEGYRVATEMAEHGAAGSTFSDWWEYKLEAFDAIPHNAAIMHQHGVLTALNSDIPWLQGFMSYEFQKPVRFGGVSKEEALQMLTLSPARMMHIDERVGSLEVGKDGDVVLLNGDPFDTFSRVETTVIDGLVYFDYAREGETRLEPFNAPPVVVTDGAAVAGSGSGGGLMGAAASAADESGAASGTEPSAVPASGAPDVQSGTVALVGATVHPVSREPIENGVVVMSDGRITAVGAAGQVDVPAEARTVDVSGKHVYPGMIDPASTVGLLQIGSVATATDLSERGSFNPHIRALTGIQPYAANVGVTRAAGITTVLSSQTGGVVNGTAAVVQLRGDTWEKMSVVPEAAVVVNFPAPSQSAGARTWETFDHDVHGDSDHGGASDGSWGPAGLPAELAPQADEDEEVPTLDGERMEALVDFFQRARAYTANPSVADDPTAPFEVNVWGGDRTVLEAMVPVMRGERPVLFRAQSEWQIKTLFVFLDEFSEVDAVLVGGAQAFRVADELARRDLPVIVTSALSPTPDRDDSFAASFRNPAVLEASGVRFAFGTESGAYSRRLPQHAAHSVAYGLSPEAGLRAVTLGAAEVLGLDGEMGSLDPGKRADVIVTDGDPLQILTHVERMWVGGVEMDPADNKHDRLHEQFRNR